MVNKSKARSTRRQRRLRRQVRKVMKKVDSMVFFNLLTSPQLLEPLEGLLPEFRERLYPPTVTLAMFLGQVLSSDGSCQNAVNGKGTGEYGLFRELLECFVEGDVMVADSYCSSYFLIAALLARGVDFVFEQHGARNTDFRTGEKLGSRDHVVKWSRPKVRPQWMTVEEYESYPQELTVRKQRPKPFPRLHTTRHRARGNIKLYGFPKKLRA